MAIEPLNNVRTVQMPKTAQVQPTENRVRMSNTDVADTAPNAGTAGDTGTDSLLQETMNAQTPSQETVKRTINNLNKNMANTEAVFGIHDGTNRVTIKIIDKNTKEVIKEFPPEKTLDMIEKVWEMAGIMVDEKR